MTSLEEHESTSDQLNGNSKAVRPLSRSPHPYSRRSIDSDKKRSPGILHRDDISNTSESDERGTEADDEKGRILKSLPAPPLRSRKGLRGSKTPADLTPFISPFPTPPAIHDDRVSFFEPSNKTDDRLAVLAEEQERIELYKKYTRRRRAELVRRGTETVLLAFIGFNACREALVQGRLQHLLGTIRSTSITILTLYTLQPIRIVYRDFQKGSPLLTAIKYGFRIPSRFDPGSFLYPVFIPFFIAASLMGSDDVIIMVNLILGLASIPPESVPTGVACSPIYLHWALSLLPLLRSDTVLQKPLTSNLGAGRSLMQPAKSAENLSLLFPLHHTLLAILKYLTTTSLDPAELQLLSTGLINLLLFAESPQAEILKALVWVGGLCLLTFCQKALSWEIALARIPSWKFARNKSPRSGMLGKFERVFRLAVRRDRYQLSDHISSDDEDYEHLRSARRKTRLSLKARSTLPNGVHSDLEPLTARAESDIPAITVNGLARAATVCTTRPPTTPTSKKSNRNAAWPGSKLLSLTYPQAQACKWGLAAYVYLAVTLIIMVAVRQYVGVRALHMHEPFGWAVGYLFGNIPQLRFWIVSNNLEGWISLPMHVSQMPVVVSDGWIENIRQTQVGPATVRLVLSGYCLVVLAVGIGIVLRLKAVVEVDTRRKVFHGIMVAMLLPTIVIDPCFIALALGLILAIFLLLDLFRASQLPPISKPLMNFLAPYVDGRDYRGPVIVSPIFLLIGCAIPLWLSLAAAPRKGLDPWSGWETDRRELSMVSGVVCVGMGDAAASLIGRRYGRTKWYWGGGKSLEGSAAFAVAVTIGLTASHVWLRIGGWAEWDVPALPKAVMKAAVAGIGASLAESTLTSANDNVVVPVLLWLLVRGLGL